MKTLDTFILVIPDILRDDLIKAIHHEYISSSEWGIASISNGINAEIRNCSVTGISQAHNIEKNKLIRTNIDNEIHICTKKVIAKYRGINPDLIIEQDTGYELLKYETGQFYKQHTDSYIKQPRAVSCSFVLNDDYEGGEFAFFDRELVYKLEKGSCIMFPSNFMYPHEIMPVTSGTRYSIVTWFV